MFGPFVCLPVCLSVCRLVGGSICFVFGCMCISSQGAEALSCHIIPRNAPCPWCCVLLLLWGNVSIMGGGVKGSVLWGSMPLEGGNTPSSSHSHFAETLSICSLCDHRSCHTCSPGGFSPVKTCSCSSTRSRKPNLAYIGSSPCNHSLQQRSDLTGRDTVVDASSASPVCVPSAVCIVDFSLVPQWWPSLVPTGLQDDLKIWACCVVVCVCVIVCVCVCVSLLHIGTCLESDPTCPESRESAPDTLSGDPNHGHVEQWTKWNIQSCSINFGPDVMFLWLSPPPPECAADPPQCTGSHNSSPDLSAHR